MTRQVAAARDNLARPQVARDGRIMEWDQEYRENEVNHRHYSHLYGLYPGCEIGRERTPELFEAARKSIEMRQVNGGVGEGWSRAWLVNLYARLNEGDKAYATIKHLLKHNTLPNLMHTQPPIFFDGQGAGTAGVAEMLLQSQGPGHVVQLLPALPADWPTGSFTGLCARGAFEIDLKWQDGKPQEARVLSRAGNQFRMKAVPGMKVFCDGKEVKLTHDEKDGVVVFDTKANETYSITF